MDAYVPMVQTVLNGIVALFFFGNIFRAYWNSLAANYDILPDAWRIGLATVLSLGSWQGISLLG